jgi:hypothetical protein
MAEAKTTDYEESRAKDRKVRRQDYAVCILGLALVILAKIVA